MHLKKTLIYALALLTFLCAVTGIAGLFGINRSQQVSNNIIKRNLSSINYARQMRNNLIQCVEVIGRGGKTLPKEGFNDLLRKSQRNVSEPGELELINDLREVSAAFFSGPHKTLPTDTIARINSLLDDIVQLNMAAINSKNVQATDEISRMQTLVWIFAAIAVLTAIGMLVWLPQQFEMPVTKLLGGLRAVTQQHYTSPLPANGPREFAELATGYNQMISSLQDQQLQWHERQQLERNRLLAVLGHADCAQLLLDEHLSLLGLNPLAMQLLNIKHNTTLEAMSIYRQQPAVARIIEEIKTRQGQVLKFELQAADLPLLKVHARPLDVTGQTQSCGWLVSIEAADEASSKT